VTINADDPPRPDLFTWAVLRTRVVDELTEQPPHCPVALRSEATRPFEGDVPRCVARFAGDGVCGLVARPRDLARRLLQSGAWTARIEAPGYLTHDLTPAIDRARRSVNVNLVPPAPLVQIAAPVAFDAQQFTPGRGVFVQRDAANLTDEFSIARAVAPPPPLGDVPVTTPFAEPHAAGRLVTGVPMLLPDRPLHRARPVLIRGRAQRRTPGPGGTLVPATAASIGIRGLWLTYRATTATPPIVPAFCAITPALYFDYDIGATVEATAVVAAAPLRRLDRPAEAGANAVVVAPNNLLTAGGGDLLRIEDPWSPETEIVVTDGFDPVLDPNAAVTVRLRTRTAFVHRTNTVVQRVNPGAFTALGTTTREAQRGDSVVFANNLPAMGATSAQIVIARGTPLEGWHVATQPPVTPNDATFLNMPPIQPDGRFEWPAIARVAQVRVRALHAGHVPLTIDFALDYDGENALSIVFIN
jgi:hypothetical protein